MSHGGGPIRWWVEGALRNSRDTGADMTTQAQEEAVVPRAAADDKGDTTLRQAFSRWRYRDASILGLIVAAVTALDLLWVSRDSRPPYWDYAHHLGDSIYYLSTFKLSDPLLPLTTYATYPPFAYWVTDLFYVALRTTALWVAILSNVVFLAILVYGTYGIGKTLWSRRIGLLSAFFVATSPQFVSFFKEYMLDAPLAAMVALTLYYLIRSEEFSNRRYSLLFGVACGLGMLTKQAFPFFIWLPVGVAGSFRLAAAVSRRAPRRLLNLAGAAILAFAICGVWYIHNWSRISLDTFGASDRVSKFLGEPKVGSLSSLLWYGWALINTQLYLIPFLFFVVGIFFVLRREDSARRNWYPVLAVVGTYVAFTVVSHKEYRYTLGMLPAVGVIGTHWLEYIRPRIRTLLSVGLVAYGAVAFLAISFGTSLLPKDLTIHLKARPYTSNLFQFMPPESVTVTGITLFAQHGFIIGKPSHDNWYLDKVFKQMAAKAEHRPFWYGSDTDTIWFNDHAVRYYALRYGLPWVGTQDAADFLVIRQAAPPAVPSGFVEIEHDLLPYGGTLWFYGRA
jgi:hypothetical protein